MHQMYTRHTLGNARLYRIGRTSSEESSIHSASSTASTSPRALLEMPSSSAVIVATW